MSETTTPAIPPSPPAAWGAPTVSIIVVLGFAVVTILALLGRLPDGANMQTLLGAWVALVTSVVGYWIGSSAGSRAKDGQIAATHQAMLDRLPPTGPNTWQSK